MARLVPVLLLIAVLLLLAWRERSVPTRSFGREPAQPPGATPITPGPEPEPEPEKTDAPEELAPDIAESGDRELTLRLIDTESGALKSGKVRLWRLGLSETAHWTAGDRLRATVDLPVEGKTLTGLPAGRYRVDAEDQPLADETPPEFELFGPSTARDIAVRPARSFRVTVRIFDDRGAFVTGPARLVSNSRTRTADDPDWAKPRQRKGAGTVVGHGVGVSHRPYRLRSAPHAFSVRERTRKRRGRWRKTFRPEGRSWAAVTIGPIAEARDYVVPSVPLATLRAAIGAAPDAEIEAQAEAVRTGEQEWRDIPIDVRWAERRFVYTVRTGVAVEKRG